MLVGVLILLVILFVGLPLAGMALWAVLSTLVVGLLIGALGRLVIPGPQPIGLLATAAAGLCGAIIGGFLGQHIWHLGHLATFGIEVGISAAVVLGFSGLEGRRRRRRQLPGPTARW